MMLDRYVCSVLDELRSATKAMERHPDSAVASSVRHIKTLTEEIQTAVNRMENALAAPEELERIERKYKNIKKKYKELKKEVQALEEDLGKEPDRSFSSLMDDFD